MAIGRKHIGLAAAALCALAIGAGAILWPYLSARSAYDGLRARYVNSLGIDLEALSAENPDTVGWLRIDGTVVDYPVVQGKADEYLDLAFDGSPNRAGCLFVDPLNDRAFTDRVTFVYGHSLLDGSMFSCIPDYAGQGYFDEHQGITLALRDRELKLTPWVAVRVSGDDGSLHVGEFADEGEWMEYKDSAARKALAMGEQGIDGIDRLVCLVTCSYNSWNERTLLFCTID